MIFALCSQKCFHLFFSFVYLGPNKMTVTTVNRFWKLKCEHDFLLQFPSRMVLIVTFKAQWLKTCWRISCQFPSPVATKTNKCWETVYFDSHLLSYLFYNFFWFSSFWHIGFLRIVHKYLNIHLYGGMWKQLYTLLIISILLPYFRS